MYAYQFANVSELDTPHLDTVFNEAGLLGTMPCTTTGANAMVLTPFGVPAVGAPSLVLQPQVRVSGWVATSNTGATTANVANMGALNVYKDGAGGPTALTGGELIAGNYFVLSYDNTLNGGAGGWHLENSLIGGAPTGAAGGDLSGAFPNPTVAKINGVALGTATASSGALLVGSGTTWISKAVSGDAALASTGALTVTKTSGAAFTGLATAAYVAPTSWTPTDGSGAGLSLSGVSANYTRNANMVFAYFALTYPATADGSAAIISGLPVAIPNQTYAAGPAACWVSGGSIAVIAVPIVNGSTFRFVNMASAANVTNANLSGLTVRCNLIYPAT